MANSQVVGTSFADGLRAPNYSNGRLLTAEDLKADQSATLTRLSWLGQAVGPGIVAGLWVTQTNGVAGVQVTDGLCLNRLGQPVRLPSATNLSLAPAGASVAAVDAAEFDDCNTPTAAMPSALAAGAYLLTVAPVSRVEGLAPLKAAVGSTSPPGCAAKWEVDGLQFKAIRLTGFDGPSTPASSPSFASRFLFVKPLPALLQAGALGTVTDQNRRNLLAHWCFGSLPLQDLARDPFTFDDQYSGFDQVAPGDLTPSDVPLAVFYWTGSALGFVDAWAARRRTVRPLALEGWQGVLSDRRVADAQARFLQFQGQIDDLLDGGSAGAVAAATYFRLLPPVGFLPVRAAPWLCAVVARVLAQLLAEFVKNHPGAFGGGGSELQAIVDRLAPQLCQRVLPHLPSTGFDLPTFFGAALPSRLGLISRESVDFMLQRSWYDDAIDLAHQPAFDLYLVEEVAVRLIEEALLQVIEAESNLFGLAATGSLFDALRPVITADLARLGQPDASAEGVQPLFARQDRLYIMFVKTTPPAAFVDFPGQV
ncbi:MAG TPA: hypothetical protein VII06_35285 [Chloroflexota bacterium]|jgi:hypothetical protein